MRKFFACVATAAFLIAWADVAFAQINTGVPGTGISQPAGGTGLQGWLSGIYKALTGTLTANVGGAAGAAVTMQNAAVANGNGTSLTVTNYSSAIVNVNCSVACSGGTTINFEGTDSTGTFFSIAAVPLAGTSAAVNSATTSGQFCVPVAGLTTIRSRISAYSAGTITVTGAPIYGQACGLSQIVNANANGQAASANSSPVVLASDQSVADQCAFAAKSQASVNLAASGQVITGTSAKKTYICSIDIVSATAQNIALVEGTGTTCATNIFGLAGGTTAATGWNFSANGGLAKGSGQGVVYTPAADANATAANVCLLSSSTGQISGSIQYVQK